MQPRPLRRYGPFPPTPLRMKAGGAEGIRTPDPHNAIVVLYQLSYDPSQKVRHFTGTLPIAQGKSGENPMGKPPTLCTW
jgi:hypothetical protein